MIRLAVSSQACVIYKLSIACYLSVPRPSYCTLVCRIDPNVRLSVTADLSVSGLTSPHCSQLCTTHIAKYHAGKGQTV